MSKVLLSFWVNVTALARTAPDLNLQVTRIERLLPSCCLSSIEHTPPEYDTSFGVILTTWNFCWLPSPRQGSFCVKVPSIGMSPSAAARSWAMLDIMADPATRASISLLEMLRDMRTLPLRTFRLRLLPRHR